MVLKFWNRPGVTPVMQQVWINFFKLFFWTLEQKRLVWYTSYSVHNTTNATFACSINVLYDLTFDYIFTLCYLFYVHGKKKFFWGKCFCFLETAIESKYIGTRIRTWEMNTSTVVLGAYSAHKHWNMHSVDCETVQKSHTINHEVKQIFFFTISLKRLETDESFKF